MTKYRRRTESNTWHWCRNCSNWPTRYYEERTSKPTTGELDKECKAKQRSRICRT